ncbi:MAG: ATPase, T2SS/T4P/T4SS family [Pirellulaceae bacterium]
MRIIYSLKGSAEKRTFERDAELIRIGSEASNDIVLSNPFVSPRHAVLSRNAGHWELTNLGENEVLLRSQRLLRGERAVLATNERIEIFPFLLTIETRSGPADSGERLDERIAELILQIHGELLERIEDVLDAETVDVTRQQLQRVEEDITEIARMQGFLEPASADLLMHAAGLSAQSVLLSRIMEDGTRNQKTWTTDRKWAEMVTASTELERELFARADSVDRRIDPGSTQDISEKMELIDREFWKAWKAELKSKQLDASSIFVQYAAHRYIKKQIKDILFGYGPLEDLIRMPNITEIMVVSQDKIYVEKNGVLERSGRRFVSDEVTEAIIDRIVSRVGRRIDRSQPLVDARLIDGSRVNAIIRPIAISGPCLTIRKFPAKKLTVEDLIRYGALTRPVRDFLEAAVVSGKNVLISGGTGTGKTTMLNCLSDFIPDKERIVTIEDTAELQLKKEHVVTLETKVANVEGRGEYTIRDLVRNALRMRPDRIVVGECRGPEALDMLQAMNTGHDGSMTTIHANSSEDVVQRLEVLVQSAADLPIESIHRQIASAIDVVVQLKRLRDGARRISQVTEFVAYDPVERRIRTKDLFVLNGETPAAKLCATGALPTFMGELIEQNLIKLEHFYR